MDKKIIEIYNARKKKFNHKLIKIIKNGISVSDANKLIMYFCGQEREDIMEIILNYHPDISSIDVIKFIGLDYVDGILLLIKFKNISPESLLMMPGVIDNIRYVEILLRNPHFNDSNTITKVLHSCDTISNQVLKMIVDKYFSSRFNNHMYFVILPLAVKNKEIAMHIINNFNKWGNNFHRDYISGFFKCVLAYDDFDSQKMIYEHLDHFFSNSADYKPLVEKLFLFKNTEDVLKMILLDKPHLVDHAVELLNSFQPDVSIYKIVLALSDCNFVEGRTSFVKKFNKNPWKVRQTLRKKLGLPPYNAMIFALTIFLCDDFYVLSEKN